MPLVFLIMTPITTKTLIGMANDESDFDPEEVLSNLDEGEADEDGSGDGSGESPSSGGSPEASFGDGPDGEGEDAEGESGATASHAGGNVTEDDVSVPEEDGPGDTGSGEEIPEEQPSLPDGVDEAGPFTIENELGEEIEVSADAYNYIQHLMNQVEAREEEISRLQTQVQRLNSQTSIGRR